MDVRKKEVYERISKNTQAEPAVYVKVSPASDYDGTISSIESHISEKQQEIKEEENKYTYYQIQGDLQDYSEKTASVWGCAYPNTQKAVEGARILRIMPSLKVYLKSSGQNSQISTY